MSRTRLIVAALVAGLFTWLFAEALVGSGVFVFRDAGHYYYPLFEFIRGEWLAGRVPLWNPYENLGVPLAGNPTSSVFYPGTLILFLPMGYAWAYNLYVVAHVLLAAWGAYRIARHWQASLEASGIAALSYAFCGNVLFQYANVVFLVGAAWLPLAVLAADRMLRQRRPRWSLCLGLILALMTLGGDPQMAYHAGLIAAMQALWLWWWERSGALALSERSARGEGDGSLLAGAACRVEGRSERTPVLFSRPGLLALAAGSGLILAAVQVLPALEFGRRSGRALRGVPRTLYELPGHLADGQRVGGSGHHWSDGLICRRLEPRSHHEDVYHFSVGPWRLAEYVWPNIGGRQFPIHRRWFEAIPAEGRVWVPSLYMGLLPLVLGLGAMRFRRTDARTSWLSWLVVLAVVASFGWYGPGWALDEIRRWVHGPAAEPGLVGAPFGGLYWLMTLVLPGYIYFRYPAKLLVLAALGLSLLAAAGWDRMRQGSAERWRRLLLATGGASLIGLLGFAILQPWWRAWLQEARPNVVFGPLDVGGATWDVAAAFGQTALLAFGFWWLLGRAARGGRWASMVALLLVALDLGVANRWMVACAPRDSWEAASELGAAIREHASRQGDGPPYRVYRQAGWFPAAWKQHASRGRLVEIARWEHATLYPKHNLLAGVALAEVYGTMMPYDYEVLWRSLKDRPEALSRIGVRYAVLPGDRIWAGAERVGLCRVEGEEVSVWRLRAPAPRAWIVHEREGLAAEWPPLPPTLAETAGRDDPHACAGETCRVIRYEPTRVEIAARLAHPGLVVFADQFYPGWRLEVETAGQGRREVPLVQVYRVMRGAWLPAGEHRLVYRYRPRSVFWGAAISGLGWMGLGILWMPGWKMISRRLVGRPVRREIAVGKGGRRKGGSAGPR